MGMKKVHGHVNETPERQEEDEPNAESIIFRDAND